MLIYITDSVLLYISVISNFPSYKYCFDTQPCTWTLMNISDYFLKVRELPKHGISESKRISFEVFQKYCQTALQKFGTHFSPQSRECMCACQDAAVMSDSVTPWTVALLSIRFSRQAYWSRLLCPPPGDLPDPGIELTSPHFPASKPSWTINFLPL